MSFHDQKTSYFYFLIQNYWNRLPSEVQNHIITLANCQAIHDQNKATGLDKVLSEIRDYGKLKKTWGHGHIYLSFGSWKPLGSYIYIAGYYKHQNWWLGVDNTLKEALVNLFERRATGEYIV